MADRQEGGQEFTHGGGRDQGATKAKPGSATGIIFPMHADWVQIDCRKSSAGGRGGAAGSADHRLLPLTTDSATLIRRGTQTRSRAMWTSFPRTSTPAVRPPTVVPHLPGPGRSPVPLEDLARRRSRPTTWRSIASPTIDSSAGRAALLDLVRAGIRSHCRINLVDGQATLSIDRSSDAAKSSPFDSADEDQTVDEEPRCPTIVKVPARYRLRLSNIPTGRCSCG